eukprot:3932062-Rhodomonas_salina.1
MGSALSAIEVTVRTHVGEMALVASGGARPGDKLPKATSGCRVAKAIVPIACHRPTGSEAESHSHRGRTQ